jgi:hypothetical protein
MIFTKSRFLLIPFGSHVDMEIVEALTLQNIRVEMFTVVTTKTEDSPQSGDSVAENHREIHRINHGLPELNDKFASTCSGKLKRLLIITVSHMQRSMGRGYAKRNRFLFQQKSLDFLVLYSDALHWRRDVDFSVATRHTPTVVPQKPHRTAPSAKNEQGEYATFEEALKTVLSVPHSALKTKLNAAKGKRIKKSSASHGAGD